MRESEGDDGKLLMEGEGADAYMCAESAAFWSAS